MIILLSALALSLTANTIYDMKKELDKNKDEGVEQ